MAAAPRVPQVAVLDLASVAWPALLAALREALAGTGPAVLPVPSGDPGAALVRAAAGAAPSPGTALLLPTSGSTGRPRLVELGAAALTASAQATHARLGGPGRWLLALPLTHVAGWQVVVRSVLAGANPVPGPGHDTGSGPGHRFTADGFARAAAGADVRYTSLVPAQLGRLLDDAAATAALARLDAVLLGGAPAPDRLRRRAVEAGVRVVRTYGMTETCGGCVYDGVPLDDVQVRTELDVPGLQDATGRIVLRGPVLATGYLDRPERGGDRETGFVERDTGFVERDGVRWFRTGDRGRLDAAGQLAVLGRIDDQIIPSGVNVTPAAVEEVVAAMPGVRDVVVVGAPDPEWGETVVAVLSPLDGGPPPTLEQVRSAVTARLGAPAAPRRLVVLDHLPLRGIGKPDRAAATRLAATAPDTPTPGAPAPGAPADDG